MPPIEAPVTVAAGPYPPASIRYRFGDQAFHQATSRLVLELCRCVRLGMNPDEALEALAGGAPKPFRATEADMLAPLKNGGAVAIRAGFLLTGVGMLIMLFCVGLAFDLVAEATEGMTGPVWLGILPFMVTMALAGLRAVAFVVSNAGGEENVVDRLVLNLAHRMNKHRSQGFGLDACLIHASPMVIAEHLKLLRLVERGETDAAARGAALLASHPLHGRHWDGIPLILLHYFLGMGSIMLFMSAKVFPRFIDIFRTLNVEPPQLTVLLGGLTVTHKFALFDAVIFVLFILFSILTRISWNSLYLVVPFLLGLAATTISSIVSAGWTGGLIPGILFLLVCLSLSGRGEGWFTIVANPWRLIEMLPIEWRPGRWERIAFLASLREYDPAKMPASDLVGVVQAAALNGGGRVRATRFREAVARGSELPELLGNPLFVPLNKRECSLVALACRAGTLPEAAAVLFQEAVLEEAGARRQREILLRYVLVSLAAFLTIMFAVGIYQPMFRLPFHIGIDP